MDFIDQVREKQIELSALRQDFHRHPELSFQEVRTAGIVAEKLRALGLTVREGVGRTGVVALLEGAADGPTILYRADMDALPVQELNDHAFISTVPGVMHACGHDAHTAVGLVVAEIMARQREQMKGRIKFIFQPAEEVGNGAEAMVKDGVLEKPRPDISLGMHVWGDMRVGKVAVTEGPMMSAADMFSLTVKGYGGHGSAPEETHDPVVAAAYIITALQTIVSRSVGAKETAVVTIGTIKGGDAFNIIPEKVELTGTIRTYKRDIKAIVHQRLHDLCEGIAASFGCEATIVIDESTKAVDNDPEVTKRVHQAAARVVGEENILTDVRSMGSEDMSELMEGIPGCYIFVGAAGTDDPYPHHNARFDIDEESMIIGASVICETLADYLLR